MICVTFVFWADRLRFRSKFCFHFSVFLWLGTAVAGRFLDSPLRVKI